MPESLPNPVELAIGDRRVGPARPCFVIAEAGVNHNGDPETALRLVDTAAGAGADAVKFQTFRAELLVSPDAPKAEYQKRTTGGDESQLDMLRRLELPEADHRRLIARCAERGICFLSTPFEQPSADLLDRLDVPAYKIGSGELTNLPLLTHVAGKGRPIILSTGMATIDEVAAAVEAVRAAGCEQLALLHCVSNYPADPADANLRAMATLAEAFDVPVGFSDHTEGDEVALAAVAMGACILEKHFTLDRTLEGPDHRASIEPDALAAMVRRIRRVESALGDGTKAPATTEANTAAVARRSLVFARDLPAGHVLSAGDLAVRRPGTGLAPNRLGEVVGRRLAGAVRAGQLLREETLA